MPTETIKVLELSENNYYRHPVSLHANFACVGNPLRATFFDEHVKTIPFNVIRVFKEASINKSKLGIHRELNENIKL